MTRIVIRRLVWDKWLADHVKKHSLTTTEIRAAVINSRTHKKGHSQRYLVIGRSGKRIVSVVLRKTDTFTYQVITARDSDRKERRKLYEKEKQPDTGI
jgi:uncharacterized DUF497 family protein